MGVSATNLGGVAMVRVEGRFDFPIHRDFRQLIKIAIENPKISEIKIDMSAVDYLDSSALGMLLLSRQNAISVKKTMTLYRPSELSRRVLEVANFEKLFVITAATPAMTNTAEKASASRSAGST
jgi:anti-anti-sigma factor